MAVDEATALIVTPGRWQVIGNSYVVVCKKPGTAQPIHFDFLSGGDEGRLDGGVPIPGPAKPED